MFLSKGAANLSANAALCSLLHFFFAFEELSQLLHHLSTPLGSIGTLLGLTLSKNVNNRLPLLVGILND